jgi:hypothetical protein
MTPYKVALYKIAFCCLLIAIKYPIWQFYKKIMKEFLL